MASLAVQAIAQEIETVSPASGDSGTDTEALVALPPSEIEGCLAKRHSADGAVISKDNAALAEVKCMEKREQSDSAVSLQSAGSMTGDSESQESNVQSKEESQLSVDPKCSQESCTSESSVKSSVSSTGKSDIVSKKFANEDSNSSSNSTLKANENSRSSSRKSSPEKQSQSQSTVKSTQSAANDLSDNDSRDSSTSSHSRLKKTSSQTTNDKSDDESSSRSSFKSVSRRSSPEKQSQSQSTVKSTQSIANDLSDNDSRDSSISSHSSRLKKTSSQTTNDKSDDESSSRSSFKSVSRKDSSKKQSQSQSTIKSSQSTVNDLSDDDLKKNKSTKPRKSRQTVDNNLDSESNSSKRSLPEKESQTQSSTKSTQSANNNLLEDNETRSSFTNSQSKSTKNSKKPVIDSSDDESNSRSSFKSNSNKSTPTKENKNSIQKKKYFSIIDSDSEDDIVVPKKSNFNKRDVDSHSTDSNANKKSKTKKTKKIKNVFDSDSEDDSVKEDNKLEKKEADSDDDQSDSNKDKGDSSCMSKSNKLSNLIDSDSESDNGRRNSESENVSAGEENDAEKPKKGKKVSEKKRKGSARASKDAAMQQIYSETQRLIRESELSLPYHRPKQRTLQEFLSRKKINISIPEIPNNLTSAEKMRMFPEVISKVVEEKEKEAEIFYQSSDSEEDEKTEPMEVDECNKGSEINTGDASNAESSNAIHISDTQKLTQDYIQESHNKREIIQRRSLDFGVPRKLFMEDEKDTEDIQSIQNNDFLNNEENADSGNLVQLNKKTKEVKTGLRESSIPKKLFAGDSEEMEMEVDSLDSASTSEGKPNVIKESVETSEVSTASTEKKTLHEDGTENFVLQLAETEAINIITESNETGSEKKDQEGIMIGETPFKSHKDLGKTEASKMDEIEKLESILETDKDVSKDDEIIDHNVLRADFGLPPELEEPVKKPTMKERLLASALKFKPVIKASPGTMIDFSDNDQIKEGVTKLLDRFARHSAKHIRPNDEEISEVKVLRTEGSGNDITVIEETLPFTKAITEDDPKKESKPGEKLKKLREDLKRKIVTARNEEWKQKEDKWKEDEEEEEKCKGDDFYADLPEDEEILEDEESAESEPEEDDIPIVDKPRKKGDFEDDEAEESEDEGAEDNDGDENEDEEEEESEDDETEKEEEECDKPKTLKRILQAFDEDSNQSDASLSNDALPKQMLERTKTDEDMFASQTSNGSDGDLMPPFQPRNRCGSDARSQSCKTPLLRSNNILSMISPVAHLTCLNTSLDSLKKSASKTNNINLNAISAMRSPSDKSDQTQNNCHLDKMISLPKKLFEDPPEAVNDEELLAICSGKFTNTQSSGVPALNTQNGVTDSQLLAICSGAFTSQSINDKKSDSTNPTELIGDETSQDITLTLEDEESRSSPNKKSPSAKKSDESMFSNDSKSPVKLPSFSASAFKNPMEAWLSKAKPKPMKSQKREEVTDSQLMDICSGEFPSQSIKMTPSEKSGNYKEERNKLFDNHRADVNDEELLAMCSGKFPDTQISGIPSLDIQNGFQQKLFDKQSNNVNEDDLLEICSGAFPETQIPGLSSINTQKKSNSTAPILPSKEKEDDDSKTSLIGYTIVSSSDDEENKAKMSQNKKKILKKKKKKVQKLDLSDDEDDEPKEFSDEEEQLDEIGDEDDEQFVDYDSEENEVIMVSKKDIKKVASKYLENEAELSESDWDSADEDEQDLDKLEFEEGDAEEIDENKMKDELDKIHMKRLMDEDQREVRMIQELIFDDGDLHSEGAGRERKFKWKNVDNIEDDDNLGPRSENDIPGIDDEVDPAAEIEIRKKRYEQQKFLEEQEKNSNKQLDDDFSECQLGKLGLKLVSMRSSFKSSTKEQTVKSNSSDNRLINVTNKSVMTMKSLSVSKMRGSFLARGEETLTRIAKNLPETNKLSINAVRNRKFVFEHLSPTVSKDVNDDEQENDDTPVKEKNDKSRKRKIFSSQTPRSTKKMKVDERTTGKKLF